MKIPTNTHSHIITTPPIMNNSSIQRGTVRDREGDPEELKSHKDTKVSAEVLCGPLCELLEQVYKDDAFAGVAVGGMNILACMALVSAFCADTSLQQLVSLFGTEDRDGIEKMYKKVVNDASMATAALFHNKAYVANDVMQAVNDVFKSKVIKFGNPAEALQKLNDFVNHQLELDNDIFTEEFGADLIAILVSTSLVKVQWQYEMTSTTMPFLDNTVMAAYYKYSGDQKIPALVTRDGLQMCLLPCKSTGQGETKRHMLVAVQPASRDSNEDHRELVLTVLKNFQRFRQEGYSKVMAMREVNLTFPKVKMGMPAPKSLKDILGKLGVKSIFDQADFPLKDKIQFQGDDPDKTLTTPVIGDIAHSCSVSFDEKGAVAKAVTVTKDRSLGSSLTITCDHNFVTVICKEVDGVLLPEFVCPIVDNSHLVSP